MDAIAQNPLSSVILSASCGLQARNGAEPRATVAYHRAAPRWCATTLRAALHLLTLCQGYQSRLSCGKTDTKGRTRENLELCHSLTVGIAVDGCRRDLRADARIEHVDPDDHALLALRHRRNRRRPMRQHPIEQDGSAEAVVDLDPVRVRVPIFVEGAWRATCKHAVVAKPKVVAQTASVDTKYASSDLAALRIHVADVDCACQQRRVEP
eukprot:CAMPEP_0181175272 /NCGR_PEP_ID=MMETSP1096-20121128/3990_1 /TAXON_ID=156174 ORGANISM="Chrysochromulina ericina, Strain CCMP281" /NCGR_SAMPLE_ID=MMETSP1096 /ASSEMBLY_ACC=CAM_ASM_000453 /LENGTH=209 /DNA_ID=CAMNT_0023263247 /DNA_START=546 /DNA_END=1176 /DNA_ORIENTATION=-